MIDRIFGALLTFCVLAGGTIAVGSAMLDHDQRVASARQVAQPVQVIQLPTVEISARRAKVAQIAPADTTEPSARQLQ